MSFQDIQSDGFIPRKGDLLDNKQDPSQALAAGVFQINTSVASFKRLVNQLGTTKDTPELREKIHKTRQHILNLSKETSGKLKAASEKDHLRSASATKTGRDAKLAKDFQTVLQEFEKAQKIAVEHESSYAPFIPQAVPSSYAASEFKFSPEENLGHQAILIEQKRQEYIQLDTEVVYNEAVIEERDQGIREIQQQIGEVNEIFKDLAVLVNDQSVMIDDIDSHIQSTFSATAQATRQLSKASKSQKSGSSLSCLLLVIFGVALLVVIIVLAA